MAKPARQRVNLDINERRYTKSVRWTVRDSGVVVADVRAEFVDGRCDSGPLTAAIAAHFHVDENAIHYTAPEVSPERFVPGHAWVKLPPEQPEPPTCEHLVGDDACELATCVGTPAVTTPLDRDVVPIPAEASTGEFGVVTQGREVMQRVARDTGIPAKDGFIGSTAWSQLPGVRRVDGSWFTVGPFAVRQLSYESRDSLLSGRDGYTAVYVDQDCVMRQRYARQGQIVRAIVEAVQARHDERALTKVPKAGWWPLKNPPVGFNVQHPEHGIVEVHEKSTNDGCTLRVVNAAGTAHFIDRRRDDFWVAAYGGAAIGGRDTWERYQRRVAYSRMVIAYRHRSIQHGGEAEDCQLCPGEVAGPRVGATGHWWGNYVMLPFCPQCGLPHGEWGKTTEVGHCAGAPRYPDASPDDESAASGHTAQSSDAQVREPGTPGSRFHVRAGYPVPVDLGGGRQGLTNPCWCGRIDLPEGDKSSHVYGLKPDQVTCPVCYHLFTCPWAGLKDSADRAAHCPICAHIDSCVDPQCNPKDHPGIVPEPDADFDYTTGAAVLVERIHQSIRDADLELAEKLVRAGEDYKPDHTIAGYPDGWDGLSLHVWRLRRPAQQIAPSGAPPSAADDLADISPASAVDPVDDAFAGWSGLFAELGI
ncbi:hypothetical protein [Actinoplanes sp. NPDC049118]|uniref:hypothetical protein n=1 Tax=Actinoplanes sp. NPDC049118 TaxID=3155769 RepID=UPI0033E2674F